MEKAHIVNPDDIVKINVGGVHLATSRKVLCQQPGSLLCKMFSSGQNLKMADGEVFLDRNGVIFGHVVDLLRSQLSEWPVLTDPAEKAKFRSELEFWQIKAPF